MGLEFLEEGSGGPLLQFNKRLDSFLTKCVGASTTTLSGVTANTKSTSASVCVHSAHSRNEQKESQTPPPFRIGNSTKEGAQHAWPKPEACRAPPAISRLSSSGSVSVLIPSRNAEHALRRSVVFTSSTNLLALRTSRCSDFKETIYLSFLPFFFLASSR